MFLKKCGPPLLFLVLMATVSEPIMANVAPPSEANTLQLVENIATGILTYSHFSIVGACTWLDEDSIGIPYIDITLEIDEYMPDLLVTVFNEENDDPWDLANGVFDPIASNVGNTLSTSATGDALGNGSTEISNDLRSRGNGLITKYADVIGDPFSFNYIPIPHLTTDTSPFMPYYSAAVDWPGRFGLAEKLQPETYNPFGEIVGSNFVNKWGYEYPRDMSIAVQNDYIASVLAALHAAALVTNNSPLHIVKTLDDSCGTNCAVANVIQETSDTNEIFQEIYPNNVHVQLGQSQLPILPGQSLGESDENAGNGNYVFAIWRHYRGCLPNGGKFLWASITVPPTSKSGV